MASPLLVINNPSSLLTCTPTTFTWTSFLASDFRAEIFFQIEWISSIQPPPTATPFPPPLGPGARRSIGRRALPNYPNSISVRSFTASTTDRSYTWRNVNVPEGTYALSATIDQDTIQYIAYSENFYVYNSTELSCLLPLITPSGSAEPSNSVSQTRSATTSNTPAPISTGFNELPAPAPAPVPVGGSGKSTHTGAIVGGVVGGAAAVIISIILAFFLRRQRHPKESRPAPSIISSKSGKRGNGKSGEQIGNWKGLGSVDLQDPEAATVVNSLETQKESASSSEENGPPPFPYPIPPMETYPTHEEKRASLTLPRKPARKPVPSYLADIPTTSPFTSSTNLETSRQISVSSNAHPSSLPASPAAEYQSFDSRRSSSRALKNTYAEHPKDEEETQAEMMVANLQRSANHGEMLQMKPVHYIMPDLPLDQQHRVGRS